MDLTDERAEKIFNRTAEEAITQFEKNMEELPDLEKVVRNGAFPLPPRLLLVDAIRGFTLSQYIGSISLAGMAIEIGVRESISQWFRTIAPSATSGIAGLIEELDFRRAIGFCEANELFGDSKHGIYSKLHKCYDIRNKYSHAKISEILGKIANEPIELVNDKGEKVKGPTVAEVPTYAMANVRRIACQDALTFIQLIREIFPQLFAKPV